MNEPSKISLTIEGDVSGDLEITGDSIAVTIMGNVEGNVTIQQRPSGSEGPLVEVNGEQISPEDETLRETKSL